MNSELHQTKLLKFVVWGLLVLGVINLVVLDVWIFKSFRKSQEAGREPSVLVQKESESSQVGSQTQSFTQTPFCPNSCLDVIKEATRSTKFTQTSGQTQTAGVKEFFVSFGSGTNTTEDWADVTGLAAYVDSRQYGRIKKVTFEASLHVPNGNQTAYVRLYNVTDKLVVWPSELSIEGSEPKLLISDPVTLGNGNKLYQVQMKSQLKGPTLLNQARLHITTF